MKEQDQTKVCKHCGRELPLSEFHTNGRKGYYRPECKECTRKRARERRKENPEKYRAKEREAYYRNHEKSIKDLSKRYYKRKSEDYFAYYIYNKKGYCRKNNIVWELDKEYLASIWADTCPVFGVPLVKRTEEFSDNTAELDRIVPSLGYTKGNVRWISRRANRLKSDATIDELKKIIKYMEDNGGR